MITGADAKAHYYLLHDDREAIEGEIGAKLTWHELPDKKSSYISMYLETDPSDRTGRPEQHEWLKKTTEAFHKTFKQRVKELDASQYEPAYEET